MRFQFVGAGVVLAVAICGGGCSSVSPTEPTPGPTATAGSSATATVTAGSDGIAGPRLGSGLASNLDRLTSYQFSWTYGTGPSLVAPSPGGSYGIAGTVINSPVKSYRIDQWGVDLWVVVGDYAWSSYDNGRSVTTSALLGK